MFLRPRLDQDIIMNLLACHRPWPAIVIALCFCLFSGNRSFAQLSNALSSQSPRIVVLYDGRVFQGDVSEVPGGYKVIQKGGSQVILPFTEVNVTAVSTSGAYESLRENVERPSVESHLSLARWCMANQLWSEAELEVQAALRLEPTRAEARELFQKIDSIVHPMRAPSTGIQATAALPSSSFASPVERTSTGLTQATNRSFVGQIQPLLMNQCGNGACHGRSSDQEFKLNNVRLDSGNLRVATEANLKVISAWVDLRSPEKSPLLLKAIDGTPHHARNFAGHKQQQYLVLLNWIAIYAEEMGPPAVAEKSVPTSSPVSAAGFESPVMITNIESAPAQSAGLLPAAPPQLNSIPEGAAIPSETIRLRQENRLDPFDPAVFNAMMQAERDSRR